MVIPMKSRNRINIGRAISWTLVLIWMGVIFAFSAQDVGASAEMSGGISEEIYEVVEETFPETSITEESFEVTLRNLAHFFLYLVLGFFIFNAIYQYRLKWTEMIGYSLLMTVLYALTDEIHQHYVPGRAFEIKDLLIDTFGAIVGILVIAFLYSKRIKINVLEKE